MAGPENQMNQINYSMYGNGQTKTGGGHVEGQGMDIDWAYLKETRRKYSKEPLNGALRAIERECPVKTKERLDFGR